MEHAVYYHDTDAGGVVYYANYLKYLEEARAEWLLKRGVVLKDWIDRGIVFAVYECHIRYKSPARYGDAIISTAELVEHSAAKMIMNQTVIEKSSGKVCVEAQVTLVCLGPDFKPVKIPQEISKTFET